MYNALRYVENDDKTDKKFFVSAINCPVQRAYENMMTTKQHYGKLGGNVAYHGYQSFKEGEVTPDECHYIGVETAKKIWGDEYEIVVTTHLDKQHHLHNHFVVNSVSFRTGRKFENHISDHYRLREISDAICKDRGKSVLENAPFYNSKKGAYWLHQNGKLTYRDILKTDIDTAISMSTTFKSFEFNMRKLGYRFSRNMYYEHPSVIIPGKSKPIRLDSFGDEYTKEAIYQKLSNNITQKKITVYFPLLIIRRKRKTLGDTIASLFNTLLDILELALLPKETKMLPISPELRYELQLFDNRIQQQKFLTDYKVDSSQELFAAIDEIQVRIKELEIQRNNVSNKIRRAKTDEEKDNLKLQRKELTARIKPLRDVLKTATSIKDDLPKIQQMLETEYKLEKEEFNRMRSKNYER